MSVLLDGISQHLLTRYAGHGNAFPFSISCWMKTGTLAQIVSLCCLDDGSSVQNMAQFRGTVGGEPVAASSYGSGWAVAESTSGVSVDTWHHVLAVFADSNDRRVYIDGGSKGTSVTSQATSNAGWFNVGCRFGSGTPSSFFSGRIADVAIWHSALSDANAVSLAAGTLPTAVDSGNLDEYWWLRDDSFSAIGSVDLTAVGDPTFDGTDHPVSHVAVPEKPINPTPPDSDVGTDFTSYTLSWESGYGYTKKDAYDSSGGVNAFAIYTSLWSGQTFTPDESYDVTKIAIRGKRVNSPTGTVTCAVYATSGSLPTGLPIGSVALATTEFSTDYGWVDFAFSTPISLSASVEYAIVVYCSQGDPSDYVAWEGDTGDIYPSGQYCSSLNAGSSWTAYPNQDAGFRVYADTVETYDVYVGDSVVTLTEIVSGQSSESVVVPEAYRLDHSTTPWYWRVDATNADGSTEGDVWSFGPYWSPEIISQSGSETVYVDQVPATLSVSVTGLPVPTYQWYADGSPMSGEVSNTYAPPAESSPISISYVCRVTNVSGYVDSTAMVVTWQAVPVPTDPVTYRILNMQLDLDRT